MTVTREQAQMLTTLAIACRPYRAPTWDAPGVMAAIGKVKDRSLPEVALAVILAASDREAQSPGVIPSQGSHWQVQLKPGPWVPDSADPHERCSTCDLRPDECRSRWAGDHEYVPRHVRPHLDVPRVVADLRERLVEGKAAPEPAPEPTPPPNVHAEAARAAMRQDEVSLTPDLLARIASDPRMAAAAHTEDPA